MRLVLAALCLALAGCAPAQHSTAPHRNLTVGTSQCSKHSWGTSAMAECLDRAAASQSATVTEAQAGGNG